LTIILKAVKEFPSNMAYSISDSRLTMWHTKMFSWCWQPAQRI